MTLHPSLSAPPREANSIRPLETMGPYELCWCRSGKKYKWCHSGRDRQEPIDIFEVEGQLLEALRDGYCSHPDSAEDRCSSTITKAHTIQKKGGLSAIAEAGHVMTVKPIMKDMLVSDGKPSPRKIGIGKASVFPGFCSKHDDAVFKPIEGKSLLLDKDTAFLFAYRAIAYERFAKLAQLRGTQIQREMDRGHPFAQQVAVQRYMHSLIAGIEIGMRDLDRWKAQFDERLLSDNRHGFHFLALRFDRIMPIVACTAFHPEFDLQGKPLQRLGRGDVEFDHITLTVSTFAGHTVMVFGWIGSSDGPAGALADSFHRIEDDRKADALVRLLFVQSDNLFLRPSWWNALSAADQDYFNTLTRSGTTAHMRSGDELAGDGRSLVTASIVETVCG